MKIEGKESLIFSDTPVPDLFFSEYMNTISCESIKIYLYCIFLRKYGKAVSIAEMSKKLGMNYADVQDAIMGLELAGLIRKERDTIIISDLKQKEINKIYRMKSTSTAEEAALNCERSKKRNSTVTAINNTYFQGVMSPSWYTDIDAWFARYDFDEDVMYALFSHCYDHGALTKKYIEKVAESWYSRQIKNAFDLDRYSLEQQKFQKIRNSVAKKLKLNRNLTEYEEEILLKWIFEYNYDFDIIDIALRKTTGKASPSFKYIDAIISDWNKNKLSSRNDISAYEESRKKQKQSSTNNKDKAEVPMYRDFEQREYNNELEDSFFTNNK